MGAQENAGLDRRSFLRAGLVGSLGFSSAFDALQHNLARSRSPRSRGYGEIRPVEDKTTGLPLIELPPGFKYATFGWRGDPLAGGGTTPPAHDGMGVVDEDSGVVTLVRNHEVTGNTTAFGPAAIRYDRRGPGGTTRLRFDTRSGKWLTGEYALSGTSRNCAGGPTPWGSWLTCEETTDSRAQGFTVSHGWVFEVPATEAVRPQPLRDMGRFVHEAVCVDPRTGFVYETEDDRYTAGFYRFRPDRPHTLHGLAAGGQLDMLKVRGIDNADLMLVRPGDTFEVEWVPIPDPRMRPQNGVGPYGSFDGMTTQASGPFFQGYQAGGAQFRRLEGCWHDPRSGTIYFTDTEGGVPRRGATRGSLFRYDPVAEELTVVLSAVPPVVLSHPDNITITPQGGVLMCEDTTRVGNRLVGLTPGGELFTFAQNAVVLDGEVNGFRGDFRTREWCGASFDPSGRWLFVNIQTPGITFAITGPWHSGPL